MTGRPRRRGSSRCSTAAKKASTSACKIVPSLDTNTCSHDRTAVRQGTPLSDTDGVLVVPPLRHLLRAKDLADARYFEPLGVDDLARAAGLSRAHFSREFRRAFGKSPHAYLLTRRLERAAALLRTTDGSVAA